MILSFTSCKQITRQVQSPVTIGTIEYQGYGATLDTQSVMSMVNLAAAYESMTLSDS